MNENEQVKCNCEEEEEINPKTLTIKLIISAVLLIAAYFLPLKGIYRLLAFIVPYLIIGFDTLKEAVTNIFHGKVFDEEFLMALATIGAFAIGDYPEAVGVMLFFQLGELVESLAVGKSQRSIAQLMNIRPDYADLVVDGQIKRVSPQEVKTGDIISVKPGEKIPLDGQVIEGITSVDTSALTGESLPQEKLISDQVISGCVNLTGLIKVKVTSEFGQSTVAKILDLVQNSSEKKAKTENFITRFSHWYTPSVVIAALLLAIIPPLFFGQVWEEWINRALVFLVISCPCALVISVPLSFFGGIGGASKTGILIKGSNYLEKFSKVTTMVFDKTGTLTEGKLSVSAIHPNKVSQAYLLDITAAAESFSTHPIAVSILKAHGKHIDKSRITDVKEMAGLGLCSIIDGKKVYVGNGKLMDSINADWHECHKTGTVIHIASENEYLGHIVISDTIKTEAKKAIGELKKAGIKTVMLSGDSQKVASNVAAELGIDIVKAQLLPDQKVEALEGLLGKDKTVAFVGDGINDAPVLTRSDIGVAMGALGSDAAIEAADVVLMDDNLLKLPTAMAISRKTMRIVKSNIIFALAVKGAILVLGAMALSPMWLAVFADVGVMLLAVLNSLRAMKIKKLKR